MTQDKTILGAIGASEPDIADTLVSRRDAIRKGAAVSTGMATALALGSVPVALAALSREAFGQGLPTTVQDVLDFALALEIFENEFYKAVLGTSTVAAQNAAFATVRAQVPASALPALQKIQQHEAAHVATLTGAGARNAFNLSAASFDFTGARGAGNGPFARATTELAFLLAVAQAVEDTGVRAYKGQAGNLITDNIRLEAALRIHSVEARHAAKIRRLRRSTSTTQTVLRYSGTVSGTGVAAAGVANITNPPAAVAAALEAIYAGESTTTHAGVNVATLAGLPTGIDVAAAASEAFDEPLTRAQVVSIVQPFFIPTIQ